VSRIPGALHLELGDVIAGRAPAATEVITFCGHGERAATAASLLEAEGRRVAILPGGPEAWEAAGFPVER
jgi:rhodanese-related sulfurtransferase